MLINPRRTTDPAPIALPLAAAPRPSQARGCCQRVQQKDLTALVQVQAVAAMQQIWRRKQQARTRAQSQKAVKVPAQLMMVSRVLVRKVSPQEVQALPKGWVEAPK